MLAKGCRARCLTLLGRRSTLRGDSCGRVGHSLLSFVFAKSCRRSRIHTVKGTHSVIKTPSWVAYPLRSLQRVGPSSLRCPRNLKQRREELPTLRQKQNREG